MAPVVNGRMTADIEGDFVVFMIGMRVNKPWKLHKWLPVGKAMTPMLKILKMREELGLLGMHMWVGPTGSLLVQYWRSAEHLDRFASDSKLPHAAAWRAFNRKVGQDGDVGIWHETYLVKVGQWEVIYANMPAFGLAQAGEHIPVERKGRSAAERRSAVQHGS
jgi:hypothetical protein